MVGEWGYREIYILWESVGESECLCQSARVLVCVCVCVRERERESVKKIGETYSMGECG